MAAKVDHPSTPPSADFYPPAFSQNTAPKGSARTAAAAHTTLQGETKTAAAGSAKAVGATTHAPAAASRVAKAGQPVLSGGAASATADADAKYEAAGHKLAGHGHKPPPPSHKPPVSKANAAAAKAADANAAIERTQMVKAFLQLFTQDFSKIIQANSDSETYTPTATVISDNVKKFSKLPKVAFHAYELCDPLATLYLDLCDRNADLKLTLQEFVTISMSICYNNGSLRSFLLARLTRTLDKNRGMSWIEHQKVKNYNLCPDIVDAMQASIATLQAYDNTTNQKFELDVQMDPTSRSHTEIAVKAYAKKVYSHIYRPIDPTTFKPPGDEKGRFPIYTDNLRHGMIAPNVFADDEFAMLPRDIDTDNFFTKMDEIFQEYKDAYENKAVSQFEFMMLVLAEVHVKYDLKAMLLRRIHEMPWAGKPEHKEYEEGLHAFVRQVKAHNAKTAAAFA
jgi:hypothetical protein